MTADLAQAKREHEAIDRLEEAIENYEKVFGFKVRVIRSDPAA